MSTKKRRAAFDPSLLKDLGDVLPPLNGTSVSYAAEPKDASAPLGDERTSTVDPDDDVVEDASPSTASSTNRRSVSGPSEGVLAAPVDRENGQGATTETATSDGESLPRRRSDARRKSNRRDAATRVAPPEVALPQRIYDALRAVTLSERTANPATARSYGHVVLDAVEHHADELKAHWTGGVSQSGTGLFRRSEAGRPTRRRHSKPRARVPLAGVIHEDAAVLDQLALEWGAGSRSALVERALQLYLNVDSQN